MDSTGVYVAGLAQGPLPGQTVPGFYGAFLRKYNASGSELWTRQFPDSADTGSFAWAVAAVASGIYVAGETYLLGGESSAGGLDAFVRRYDANGNVMWTRQFGTSGEDRAHGVAVDTSEIYIAGITDGILPGQANVARRDDAFVARMVANALPPAVSEGGVVNNASFAPSPAPVAPGSIAAVFGTNLADGAIVLSSRFGPDGKLVTSLGGASVAINSVPAPMFYSTPGQLGIQIPFELAGQTSATIQSTVGGQTSVSRTIFLDAFAPGIFTVNQQGTGIAAVLHEDGVTLVTEQIPARPGEVVVLFATGLGVLTPALATGSPASGNRTATTPTVTVDGVGAQIDFSGGAPGFVGLNQINVRLPANTRPSSSIPVVLTIGGKQSNTVTVPVSP